MTSAQARAIERVTATDIALPPSHLSMEQDKEWCVVCVDGEWQKIRFHDYERIYNIPGLYESLFHEVLRCESPGVVAGLLEEQVRGLGVATKDLRVLDLGAGNGLVGEELTGIGVECIVGVDITAAARDAARRDRPHVYTTYLVADLARLDGPDKSRLKKLGLNCLTCVAALGFGDIPPQAFAAAFNLVAQGGFVAFNIKDRFLEPAEGSGFSRLIRAMCDTELLLLRCRKRYAHRVATDGQPLFYIAMVGVKQDDVSLDLVSMSERPRGVQDERHT